MKPLKIYCAMSNTDLTEGRGYPVVRYACTLKETAERLCKGIGPMGSPGYVSEVDVLEHDGKLYVPYSVLQITQPTKADEKKAEEDKQKETVMNKAVRLGLTPEELQILKG
jgi:hypothetical protein